MRTCGICGCDKITKTYEGLIRDGGLGKYTNDPVVMWRCTGCDAIWHDPILKTSEYYQSEEYRLSLEDTANPKDFYKLHDKESKWKFDITGTDIFRDKVVMDVGCGMGGYLDYIQGLARKVIAIEPSMSYRKAMQLKGFDTYAYSKDAIEDGLAGKVDTIVSFDVIEHVDEPFTFVTEIFQLLGSGGVAIIGTPTEAPVMRELLGAEYEMKQLFSTQHLWVLSKKNMRLMAEKAGCNEISFKFYQRYGFGNFIGWVRDKKPRSDINVDWITKSLDGMWKGHLEDMELSDYIVLLMTK